MTDHVVAALEPYSFPKSATILLGFDTAYEPRHGGDRTLPEDESMATQQHRVEEMYCPVCGESMPREANFCPECGSENATPGDAPTSSPTTDSEQSLVDTLAPAASWLAVILMFLLAVGTITESVAGMPVRLAVSTVGYVLLGLFAAPPLRRRLEATLDTEFERAAVVVILVVGTIVNEGLIAPPLA